MINKLAKWITKHPKTVILVAVLLLIPSIIAFLLTPVNYDILSYLPEDLDSVQALDILDEDFGEASMSIIVMQGMSWDDMEKLETEISSIEAVRSVLWIGAVMDSPMPISMLPESISSMLYNADGDSTLMMVQFNTPGASNNTLKAIGQIKKIMNKQCLMSGTAAMMYDLSELTNEQAPLFIAVAIALALLALMFTMESIVLPFVLLIALGIAVIYNMGTNFMFGQISFITQSIAAILQLGVTMDYSVFLMDRYTEEKPKYKTHQAAMAKAITSSFVSLSGSSLTTIFGFLALCFMSFTLGLDIGLVMAKGVLLGIVTVIIVLPALILQSEKLIQKTRHRSLVPSFHGINKVTIKSRKIIAILFVVLLIPAYYGQAHVEKYYNMMNAVPDTIDSIAAMDTLKDEFNMAGSYFVVTKSDLPDDQKLTLLDDLEKIDGVSSVMGFNSIVGTAFATDIIPESVKSMLMNDEYQIIMVNSIYSPATDEGNAQVETINTLIKSYDENAKVTGEGPMYKDLIEVTNRDFIVTNVISITAIFVLIALIFKSISVPFILVLSIEFAIWVNMAISFLSGEVICFITPTIISCVQLGATVDYAILLTTRFREELRKGKEKKQAMQTAADSAHKSIFQSSLVFFAATFGVFLICDIDIVRSICAMLARGAIISALVIILFLTPNLVVCEDIINKTTYRWREVKRPTEFTLPMLENMKKKAEKAQKKAQKKQNRAERKASKAKPVPAELVAAQLTPESAEKIEQAMEPPTAPPEENEEEDLEFTENNSDNGDETAK